MGEAKTLPQNWLSEATPPGGPYALLWCISPGTSLPPIASCSACLYFLYLRLTLRRDDNAWGSCGPFFGCAVNHRCISLSISLLSRVQHFAIVIKRVSRDHNGVTR